MMKRMFGFTLSFCMIAYLNLVMGLPIWASMLIVGILTVPPVCFYTNLALCSVYMFLSGIIHLFTIIFAFTHEWWKGLLTAVLPGISQIYWFVVETQDKGYRNSLFCQVMLWYVFGLVLTYIMPVFLAHITKQNKE